MTSSFHASLVNQPDTHELMNKASSRRPSTCYRLILWLWVSAVVLAPVWFGANTSVIWAGHAIIFGILLAAYGIWDLRADRSLRLSIRYLRVPLVAIGLLATWAAIQSLPIVPPKWQNPIWAAASSALGEQIGGTISVFPEAGVIAILWMATAATVFFLAHEFGSEAERARLIFHAIVFSGGAIAAYGLLVYLSGNAFVLWRPKQAYLLALTATFVNKNTFAAYAGLILTVTFGLMLDVLGREDRSGSRSGGQLLALGVIFLIVSAALILAGSRAGTAVAVIGVAMVAVLGGIRIAYRRRFAIVGFALGALVIFGCAATFGDFLASKLARFGVDLDSRLALDHSVFEAIKASPWLGSGLATFEQAYPPFRAAALQQSGRWEYAHDSWLESLMTLGIPAALLLWLIFVWILVRCMTGALRTGANSIYPAIGAGVGVLAAAQSVIDFPFQIQGFAFPCLAVLGVAVAQSWPQYLSRQVAT